MNFLSMQYFATVAKRRNITKAAADLHITQQTLSAHLSALERELGAKLLIRKQPLELTYAGETFLRYAIEFNSEHRALLAEIADISGNQTGELRIGIAHTRGLALMPRIVPPFLETHPGIKVIFRENTNDGICDALRKREIDLAIARFRSPIAGAETRDFCGEEIVLVAPRKTCEMAEIDIDDGATALKKLSDTPFALNGTDDIAGNIGRVLLKRAEVKPRIIAQSESSATLLALAAAGTASCFCPLNLIESAVSKQQLERVRIFKFGQEASYRISFAYNKEAYQWSIINAFMENAAYVIDGN